MEYKRVDSLVECQECDKLLTKLICYESKFDALINPNYKVLNFFKNKLTNENIAIYIAKDKEKIIGFIIGIKRYDKSTSFNKNIILIEDLFVSEEYRNKKIGTNLIQHIENWANKTFGECVFEINVIIDNVAATSLYKKLGFKEIKTILRKV